MIRSFTAALCAFLAVPVPAAASSPSEQVCEAPKGWSEIAQKNPRFVVFGEVHGSRESPQIVGQLLCALAQSGERVLLAVELSSLYDNELQTAWKAPLHAFPTVLSSWDWQNREDGVASMAMFDLLTRARRLKADDLAVGITAFNGAKDDQQHARFADIEGQGGHEAAQAENIFQAAEAGGYSRVLVLVGNLHAHTEKMTAGAFEIEPMARRLSRMGPTVTLDHRYASGTNWGCQLRADFDPTDGKPVTQKDVTCAAHSAAGWDDDGEPAHMALGAFGDEAASASFDGYFWTGPINASPPAITVIDAVPEQSPVKAE